MTTRTSHPTGPLAFVPCPLCDEPAILEDEMGALECTACAIRLVLAGETVNEVLAPAA